MKIQDYKTEVRKHETALAIRMAWAIGAMFATIAVAGCIRAYDDAMADWLAPILMACVGFPLMLFGFFQADRTYRKFPSLMCPHCDGNIARPKTIVIATGNCPNCGRKVIQDVTLGT